MIWSDALLCMITGLFVGFGLGVGCMWGLTSVREILWKRKYVSLASYVRAANARNHDYAILKRLDII